MEQFPHHYAVTASAFEIGIKLSSPGLDELNADKPAEFDGPGDQWSPETLLVASVSSCMILSFKSVAAASRFQYLDVHCETTGVLDRVEKVTRFTRFEHQFTVQISHAEDREKAERLVKKAESICLVSNSLSAESLVNTVVKVA